VSADALPGHRPREPGRKRRIRSGLPGSATSSATRSRTASPPVPTTTPRTPATPPGAQIDDAARAALALVIACSESDHLAVQTILAAYSGHPRALLGGFVHVLRSLAGQPLVEQGTEPTDETVADWLRIYLQDPRAGSLARLTGRRWHVRPYLPLPCAKLMLSLSKAPALMAISILVAEIRKCEETIRKCLSILGISPTDRARLGLAEVKKRNGTARVHRDQPKERAGLEMAREGREA
jgi:hypothetical protein